MPLKKIILKPGVNRENTRYTNENGWYECDKIRFRQGTPEKIGGWAVFSPGTFQGTCRSLYTWASTTSELYLGVGTSVKYYINTDATYYDITPIVETVVLTNPFSTIISSNVVTVTDVTHSVDTGDFVTFSGATAVGGLTLNGEFSVTYVSATTYTIIAPSNASSTAVGGGTVTAAYQVPVGPAIQSPITGWGAGAWGAGAWGVGTPGATNTSLRIWSSAAYGNDLVFGPRGGAIYYWQHSLGVATRGVLLSSLFSATDVPVIQNTILVSDTSRIVLAFGANDYGSSDQDPMLIRWSDQEDAFNWTPTVTNQAGSLRLSRGSKIVSALQVRQEIIVWTDTSLYSIQYYGQTDNVFGSQLIADNISLVSDRAMAVAAGVTYWMGYDKFYMYNGNTETMTCDLRQYIFEDFNNDQAQQVFATTVEKFNEVWWFYCSSTSTDIDRYVVYNYVEKCWYYGSMNRTAWIDASIVSYLPMSASGSQLLSQEVGYDDLSTGAVVPIEAYITSAEFDIDDGDKFAFVWRMLPDITFRGSTVESPSATLTLLAMQNSGSGYNNSPNTTPAQNSGSIIRSSTIPIEKFTGQINVRVRGRQMALEMRSTGIGVAWQLGSPRIDIRLDGRR